MNVNANRICYHHNDMDGRGAGYVLYRYLLGNPPTMRLHKTFFEMDYNKKINIEDCKGKYVYILDLSYNKDTINQILEACKVAKRVTWIDHHQTSIDTVMGMKEELDSIENLHYFLSNEGSGALLTYFYIEMGLTHRGKGKYINFNIYNDKEQTTIEIKEFENDIHIGSLYDTYFIPRFIRYIDDYDRWIKKYPESDLFNIGCKLYDTRLYTNSVSTCNSFWGRLAYDHKDKNFIDKVIEKGKFIQEYDTIRYSKDLAKNSYESTVNGTTFLCMNHHGNSFVFGDKINEYDAVVLWSFDGTKYNYSLYSAKRDDKQFNCKEFCEKYGGGGHIGAAGFGSKELIFKRGSLDENC